MIDRNTDGGGEEVSKVTDETLTFFFSSRRRHTRYIGDWSSDVCSSDLDYVFYTPDSLEVLDVRVLTAAAQASDHLPVVVRLRFR